MDISFELSDSVIIELSANVFPLFCEECYFNQKMNHQDSVVLVLYFASVADEFGHVVNFGHWEFAYVQQRFNGGIKHRAQKQPVSAKKRLTSEAH